MKTLGFGIATSKRVDGNVGKYYNFNLSELSMLVKRYSDDPDFIEKFCNRVTVVTVVTEGPDSIKKNTVTVETPSHKDGYNGYTVTLEFLRDCAGLMINDS
jgi:hypothetical protein